MLVRNIQILRLTCRQNRHRLFSTTHISRNLKEEKIQLKNTKPLNDILPIDDKLPALANLPSYLPEPTGVKSKLFNEFYLIYRFRYHRFLRYIQILKISQTLATALVTPYQFYCYSEGLITTIELHFSVFLLTLASSSLIAFGWAATRSICFIYTNVDCTHTILSHVDFWGRRKNIEMTASDVVPINDIETPDKTFLPFKRYSTTHTMYYSVKLSEVLDRPRFNRLFAGIITQDKKTWW